jgi:ParB family chromosome partitioning protein
MAKEPPRNRLGRGLSSLIRSSTDVEANHSYESMVAAPVAPAPIPAPVQPPAVAIATPDSPKPDGNGTHLLPVDQIRPNPYQPRRQFEPEALAELSASIKAYGLLQPVVVVKGPDGDGDAFYLVAGERRLRAARQAGVQHIPCVVRQSSRQEMLELALIENIHRRDLDAMEKANAYRSLMDQFAMTQQDVAARVGQPRATVANYLRLLELCDDIQAMIRTGQLSFGHAKVISSLAGMADKQLFAAEMVARDNLSVRKLEDLVQAIQGGTLDAAAAKTPKGVRAVTPYLADVERQLTQAIGTKVTIKQGRAKHSGRIMIEYYNLEDFDKIASAFGAKIES